MTEDNIILINNLIFQAYAHGGDSGGPYNSNYKNVTQAINDFIWHNKLNEEYHMGFMSMHGYLQVPQIIKNSKFDF